MLFSFYYISCFIERKRENKRDFVNILLSITIKQRITKEKKEADNTWNAIEAVFEGVNEQDLAN